MVESSQRRGSVSDCKCIVFPGNKLQLVLTPRMLGKGQFGSVRLSYLKRNPNKVFAVKIIDRKKLSYGKTVRQAEKAHNLLLNEIQIMTEIQHKHVVSLVTATKTHSNYYLMMEFCNGGDLAGFIKARGGYLPENEARLVLYYLVQGLMAIRAKKVIHRDLKLPNVMIHFPRLSPEIYSDSTFDKNEYVRDVDIVGSNGNEGTPFEVKIADLGFARKLEEDQLSITKLGTPLVMAPEVLGSEAYNHNADVWSLGCIFYELLVGFTPFTGRSAQNLLENITKGDYHIPKSIKLSVNGLSFLVSCLQFNSDQRPSLHELVNHPYIRGIEDSTKNREDELFLSYHPDSKSFYPDQSFDFDSHVYSGSSHSDLLNQKNPHEWMQYNPDKAAELNVHGHESFRKIVYDRYAKLQQELKDSKVNDLNLSVIEEREGEEEGVSSGRQDEILIETSYLLLDYNKSKLASLEAELSASADGGTVFNNNTIIGDYDLDNFEQIHRQNQDQKQYSLGKKYSRGAQLKEIEMINRIDDMIVGPEEDWMRQERYNAIYETVTGFYAQFF